MSVSFPTGDFVTTSLIGSIDSSQDTATIGAGLTLPATNGVLVIDYDSTTAVGSSSGPETIIYATYNTGTGALAGITRGAGGTTGVSHANTASVQCSSSSVLYTEVSDRLTAVQAGAALALIDGWQDAAETWTYASGTSVTVPAGNLLKREVGDKVKFNQSIPIQNYWTFNTNSTDSIAGITMTNIGTPAYTTTGGEFKFTGALKLNGTNNALQVGSDTASSNTTMQLGKTAPFTVGCWMRAGNTGAAKMLFQSYGTAPSYRGGIDIVITAGNVVSFEFGDKTSANVTGSITGSVDVCTGAGWHYIVCSYQSGVAKIFVDGVLDKSGSVGSIDYNTTNYVRIGCNNNAGTDNTWFNGQIDDLFIINGHAVDSYWVAAKYAEATAQGTGNITATYKGYVTAVTDTLLTVTGGADYAVYNGAITNPYYSKVSSPVGFPQWFNRVPTGVSTSNVALTGRFRINGREVREQMAMNFTGAITFTTNPTLAVTASASMTTTEASAGDIMTCGTGGYRDSGTGNYPGYLQPIVTPGATTVIIMSGAAAAMSASSPITWANGDSAWLDFSYEI